MFHIELFEGWFMTYLYSINHKCHFVSNFTLSITMEVEFRIPNSTNATTVVFAKITGVRWWRMGKKCVYIVSWLTRRLQVHGKNVFCILQSTKHEQQALASCQTHYESSKIPLKLSLWTLWIRCHCCPLWRKYAPEVKTAKGLKVKRC